MLCQSGVAIRGGYKDWGEYGTQQACATLMVRLQLIMCNESVGVTSMGMFCSRDGNDYIDSGSWDEIKYPLCNWGPVQY